MKIKVYQVVDPDAPDSSEVFFLEKSKAKEYMEDQEMPDDYMTFRECDFTPEMFVKALNSWPYYKGG